MFFGEADTVVANAETLLALFVFECFDPAGAGFGQAVYGRQNIHGDVLGDSPDVGLGFIRDDDPFQETGSLSSSSR